MSIETTTNKEERGDGTCCVEDGQTIKSIGTFFV